MTTYNNQTTGGRCYETAVVFREIDTKNTIIFRINNPLQRETVLSIRSIPNLENITCDSYIDLAIVRYETNQNGGFLC